MEVCARRPVIDTAGLMRAEVRSDRALLLAAMAVLGLVVAPLLHAEEHVREKREEEAETSAAADAWRAGSPDPSDRLAFALEHAHDAQGRHSTHEKGHGERHRHSQGPAGSGPHGSNALAHFGLALRSTPPAAAMAVPAAKHASRGDLAAQLCGTPRHLISEWSQGPPVDC